jgi:hypothetical protein
LQDSPIHIGPISLQGFEIPASVRFGGRQRLVTHNLHGGRRYVERLGPDDGEIAFEGTFSGVNAEARVRAFDTLRLSGAIVWLQWETFRRQVVVKSFITEYHSPWWICYKVSCVVVHQSGVTLSSNNTNLSLITADINAALAAASNSPVSLSQLETSVSQPNALISGTSSQGVAIAAVGSALEAINSQIDQQSDLVASPLSEEAAGPMGFSQGITLMVEGAELLARAVNARSYVGRIRATLQDPGT